MNIRTDPESIIGLASITRMAFSGVDLSTIGARLIERIESNPRDANSLMDLSTILLAKNRELALKTQAQALQIKQLYRVAPSSALAGVRLLAMMAPGDLIANTPLEFLLEGSNVELHTLYVGSGLPLPESVPDHDVLFLGIGESDASRPLLQELSILLESWPRPVLNRPERILFMSREGACGLLHGARGIEMPLSARIDRDTLAQIGRGEVPLTTVIADGKFPIIVRPVDSHMGRGLVRLESPAAITHYLETSAQPDYYLSRFVDYRDADGQYRKYRVVLIDGQPFACHLAMCEDWVVHYQRAGMADSADKRAEEERFMVRFDEEFGRRHAAAFKTIHERCGLDYLGIDCAETKEGELLVFEVDNAVLVHAMDPVDLYPYKQPQMHKVFEAFGRLLARASERHTGSISPAQLAPNGGRG